MNKMRINTLVVAMGIVSTLSVTTAAAAVNNYDWNGVFRLLDPNGLALVNTSLPSRSGGVPANQFDTPISGTLAYDTVTGAGTATMAPFDWGGGVSPFENTSFDLQAIGDGMGGSGTLVLGNLLFNWNGNSGLPVSIILDAQGFFAGDLDGSGGLGATPASDGIYVGSAVPDTGNGPSGYPGYLSLGPIPIATTAWNTTDNCTSGVNCLGATVNGILPLVFDNTASNADYSSNTGGSIGGSPSLDGSFSGSNFNFDFTDMTLTGVDANATISAMCSFDPNDASCFGTIPAVPVPAAVWLFGSGLLGLLGAVHRRKT